MNGEHHQTKGVETSDTLAVFSFGAQEVRVGGTREAPLFCAADICAVLGIVNPRDAVASHPEEEKGVSSFDTPGGKQEMQCVTEPGLYRLIFRSYKPKAEEFRRWVFREVLPSLRNTGHFAVPGRAGEAADVEGRVTTFIRITEALVKLGAKPVTAGNAALRWLPVITAGLMLPAAEDKNREELEELFGLAVAEASGAVVEIGLPRLRELAAANGLLKEVLNGGERAVTTRLGMCLRPMRGAVIETGNGVWTLRKRAHRTSAWVLRRAPAA